MTAEWLRSSAARYWKSCRVPSQTIGELLKLPKSASAMIADVAANLPAGNHLQPLTNQEMPTSLLGRTRAVRLIDLHRSLMEPWREEDKRLIVLRNKRLKAAEMSI